MKDYFPAIFSKNYRQMKKRYSATHNIFSSFENASKSQMNDLQLQLR